MGDVPSNSARPFISFVKPTRKIQMREYMTPNRTSDTYVDVNGNKVVEPIFNGGGGSVGGMVGVRK